MQMRTPVWPATPATKLQSSSSMAGSGLDAAKKDTLKTCGSF